MKKIWKMAGVIAMAVCFYLAVQYGAAAGQSAGIATALLKSGFLERKTAQQIEEQELTYQETTLAKEQETVTFCFWGEQDKTLVQCKETGGSSTVTMIVMEGNPELIVPGISSLIWQEKGCYLDQATASELFGTREACGQMIWCGQDAYTVCGTFESLRKIMVRQAQEQDGEQMDTVSIRCSDDQNVSSEAQQFLMRHGLDGEIIDFEFLGTLCSNLLLVLPAILTIGFSGEMWRRRKKAGTAYRKAACLLAVILVSATAVIWAGKRLTIPANMIPTKWSDFSFWDSWWEKQRQNLLLVLSTAQGEAQLAMLWNFVRSVLCNLIAVFLGMTFCLHREK